MITQLARVPIIVKDQDEALKFYVDKLGLEKREDRTMGPGMRWVTVAPKGQKEVEIVLQQPGGWQDAATRRRLLGRVGKGTTWVFFTDDCNKDYETFRARGVKFVRQPAKQPYGAEALFEDLYGNQFSLLQRP